MNFLKTPYMTEIFLEGLFIESSEYCVISSPLHFWGPFIEKVDMMR